MWAICLQFWRKCPNCRGTKCRLIVEREHACQKILGSPNLFYLPDMYCSSTPICMAVSPFLLYASYLCGSMFPICMAMLAESFWSLALILGRHVRRVKLPWKKAYMDMKNGLKNAKKDPKNDPKRVRRMLSPSHATEKFLTSTFLKVFSPTKICTKKKTLFHRDALQG